MLFLKPVPVPSSPADGLKCPHKSLPTSPSPPSLRAAENEREGSGGGLIPHWILPASCHLSPLTKPLWLHTKPLSIASPTCLAAPCPPTPRHLPFSTGTLNLLVHLQALRAFSWPAGLHTGVLGHPCACGELVNHPLALLNFLSDSSVWSPFPTLATAGYCMYINAFCFPHQFTLVPECVMTMSHVQWPPGWPLCEGPMGT